MPSGAIVDVKKNAAEREALRLSERLGIVNARDLGDGHVYWLWQYGDDKPPDPAALALLLPDALGYRF